MMIKDETGKIRNGKKELIMVYLTKKDKENIRDMHPDCDVYSEFPNREDTDYVIGILDRFKAKCKEIEWGQ